MKKYMTLLLTCIIAPICLACRSESKSDDTDDQTSETPVLAVPAFAKGADISWVTEMESKGLKFSTEDGKQMECTALMKSLGMNSIRLRVWVNPVNGWSGAQDVLKKAKRASDLGMNLMIDFHYSDSWADPGKQKIPAAWEGQNFTTVGTLLANHTKEVLKLLKDNGIDVTWVQVGNETPDGMLWELGRASTNPANFAHFVNCGHDAVKEIYPEAKVIVHVDNAFDLGRFTWLFDILKGRNVRYDMIGMSLYPSYWDDSSGDYPDWKSKTEKALANIGTLYERYGKELIIVETGMPESRPDMSYDMLSYLLKNAKSNSHCKGVFYWEPESSRETMGYDYGAFSAGKPTKAMKAFAEN